MSYLWDYDKKELKKTHLGRAKILERKINYGTGGKEKISKKLVKKYWKHMDLFSLQKRLFELIFKGK